MYPCPATRNTVGSDIQEHLGTVAAKAYQLGMSMQDSAAIAGLTMINPALGKMGTMLLGGASATQTMLDAVERGASDEQAIGLGLLSGAFEIFFEKYELDELLDNVKYAAKGAGKGALVKTMARQALTEGVGEGATEIANILADCAVMAEKSNWQLNIEKYITEKNMSPKEARKQAFIDAALQVGEAVVGGLISGSVSSSAYTGVQTLANHAAYTKTGATIMDADGGVEALINSANQVAGVSSEDVRNMLTSQIDKVTQNPTARNVGQLYATVQTASNQANAAVNQANTVANQEDVAKSLISKGFTAKKADGIAEAIIARLNGQELTRPQRNLLSSALNSSAVRDTISELINHRKTTTEQSSQNIRENMLPDQASRDIEKLQQDQILKQRYHEFSEAIDLPEQHEGTEKSGFTWEHGNVTQNNQTKKKVIAKTSRSGIMKVDTGGNRNETPLTDAQIRECVEYAVALGVDRDKVRYGECYNTAYGSVFNVVYIGTDIGILRWP